MITVKIAYDPYHMKTSLNINGQNVKRNARGYERISNYVKQDIPLQSWIDPIPFQNWAGLLWEVIGASLEGTVEFHFRGRKIDFLDFQEAMTAQSRTGKYEVHVIFPEDKQIFCYDDQEILKRVKKSYELIHSDGFKQIIDDKLFEIGKDSDLYNAYQQLPKRFKDAMDGEFRIVFSGMYTCGKSTIINAILGKDILPTRDGTCTSKVFKISHDPYVAYAKMSCVDKEGNIVVEEQDYTEETLKDKFNSIFPRGDGDTLRPSDPPTIDTVLISTNMSSLYPANASYQKDDMKLVIVDTPGTSSGEGNSAIDGTSHFDIAKGVIESDKKEIVVFATNATVDKDQSIIDFLNMVDDSDPKRAYDQRYLFVLNKADGCNLKEDESWPKKLQGIQHYYTDGGKRAIKSPRFFPTSALVAFLIRTNRANGAEYTSIRDKYYYHDEDAEEYVPSPTKGNFHFDEFCSTSQAIKDDIAAELNKLKNSTLKGSEKRKQEILLHSGIVSLEMAIRDYIERYAFPLKIQEILETYEIIFKETNQLLTITSSKFEKALQAKMDANTQKKSEEERQERKRRVKESLDNAAEEIEKLDKQLEEIITKYKQDVDCETVSVKARMSLALEEAKKVARNNRKDPKIRSRIKNIVDNSVDECHDQINTHFLESRKQTRKLEENVQKSFQRISALIDFGEDFSINNTVTFQAIHTDSITAINNKRHRNPKLDEGLGGIFKVLRYWLIKDKQIDDGIDLNELNKILADISTAFDLDIDRTFNASLEELKNASNHLGRNIETLNKKIGNYASQLKTIEENVDRITSDITQKAATEKKFHEYKQLLSLVQNYTCFNKINEE